MQLKAFMQLIVDGILAYGAGNGKISAPVLSVYGGSGGVLFTATDIPEGLTINAITGEITGNTSRVGNGSFSVVASDGSGGVSVSQVAYSLSSLPLFWWTPQKSDNQNKPKIFSAKFGDGYQQDIPQGLNPNPATYSLTFAVTKSAMSDILGFLDSVIAKPFAWVPDGATSCKAFKCNDYKGSSDAISGQHTVMATFNQVFGY